MGDLFISLPSYSFTKLTIYFFYYIMILQFGGKDMKEKKNKTLEHLRIKYGLSYQQMALKVGICKSYYWHLEHNNRRLYYDTAKKIAAVFHLKPDDIFYTNEEE